jgi:alkylated DNA repair dioxygenase AlkB
MAANRKEHAMSESQSEPPVAYYPAFLSQAEAREWLERSRLFAWSRGEINMYGKAIPVPREECLYGDDLRYQYRSQTLKALPWPDLLIEARDRIEQVSGFGFNFAVGNRYLTGKDSIGWHADNYPQIGTRPAIASLSLGDTRNFKLKHKATGATFDYRLESGSLLIMLPGCQDDWLHAVPKTARPVGERINWTFRPHVDADLASTSLRSTPIVGEPS